MRPLQHALQRLQRIVPKRTKSLFQFEHASSTLSNNGIVNTNIDDMTNNKHAIAIRSFSSKKEQLAARDTRMAGRRRFYDVVDVIPHSPPWIDPSSTSDSNDDDANPNPISAGVDGTKSATGVSIEQPIQSILQSALTANDNKDTSWYGITLDDKPLRTPLGTPLSVPSLPLALSIASEWNDQKTHIQPAQMPLMTLVCTTLDQMTNPTVRIDIEDQLMAYLRNDTTCYWTDPLEDRVFHRRQKKHWDDLHKWISTDAGLGSKPAIANGANEGLIMSRKRKGGKSYVGLPHEEEVIQKAGEFLKECDVWTLTAMQSVTMTAKSFLVGMAVIQSAKNGASASDGPFSKDTSKAVMASRVEEEFQIENWGLVEGGHDYDRLNCSISIHAATVLVSSVSHTS